MIIPDANILLYAWDTTSTLHAEAKDWIELVFSGSEPVGLAWQNIAAFLRVITNPRLTRQRFTIQEAVAIVAGWMEQPNIRILPPGELHWNLLRDLLTKTRVNGPDVTDAQLAALTIEYGGILYTTDRGFARFPGLRWTNPLSA